MLSILSSLSDGGSPPPPSGPWNPADKGSSITLSNTDHTASSPGTSYDSVRGVLGRSSGHYYFEFTHSAAATLNACIGVATAAASITNYPGGDAFGWSYYSGNGQKITNNAGASYGATYAVGDVIGVEYDNGDITFWKNGVSQGLAFSGISGAVFPHWGPVLTPTHAGDLNTGDSPFVHAIPSGAIAWDGSIKYAWNPADKDATVTLSNTDHTASTSTAAAGVRAVTGHSSGHYYFEFQSTTPGGNGSLIGLGLITALMSFAGPNDSWGYFFGDGRKINNPSGSGVYGPVSGVGDIIGVEYNNGDITFWKNGASLGTAFTGVVGALYPMWCFYASGLHDAVINTGDTVFAYSLPSGASAWG